MRTAVMSSEEGVKSLEASEGLPMPLKRVKRLVRLDGAVSINGSMFAVPQFAGQWVYVYSDGIKDAPCRVEPIETLFELLTKGTYSLSEIEAELMISSSAYPALPVQQLAFLHRLLGIPAEGYHQGSAPSSAARSL